MHLSPREKDKLLISLAAMVAERRRSRGIKLNYPEALAIITDFVLEGARAGKRVSALMDEATAVLTPDEILPEVVPLLAEVQVEATFPDGAKLVTVHWPVGRAD